MNGKTAVWSISVYLLFLFLFLGIVTFLTWQKSSAFSIIGFDWNTSNGQTFQRVIYALCAGGFGGITFTIWSLLEHYCRKNNFAQNWKLWYILTPISGSLIGIATYAVIVGGLLVLGGTSLENNWAVFALCYLAGYSSKRVLWKLDSVAEELFQKKPQTPPQNNGTEKSGTP
jgi:hypothetical protein